MMLEEQEVVEWNKGKNVMVLDEQEVEKNVTGLKEQEVVEMIVTNAENQQEVAERDNVEKNVIVVEMKERNEMLAVMKYVMVVNTRERCSWRAWRTSCRSWRGTRWWSMQGRRTSAMMIFDECL